jgi:hypothetical protein
MKTEMGGSCSTYGREVQTGFQCGNLRERGHLKDLGVGGRRIFKLIKQGQVAGFCECGGERMGSVKYGEFLD